MKYLYCFILLLCWSPLFAGDAALQHFKIKESLSGDGRLAIIATDSVGHTAENINGTYTFQVSGFTQEINFTDGIGIIPLKIDKSTFIYLKHENEAGVISQLLYVFKQGEKLNPVVINRMLLLLIPCVIVVLIFAFKRFIYIGLILLLIYLYFSHRNGLSVNTFLETSFDYLKNLI